MSFSMHGAIQFQKKFDAEHGGLEQASYDDGGHGPAQGRYFWPDGSWRDAQPLGMSFDAQMRPERDETRVRGVLAYREAAWIEASAKVADLRELLLHKPHPDEAGLEELKRLASAADERGRELAAARAELEPLLPGYRSPEQIRAEREERERQERELADFRERVRAAGREPSPA